MPVIALTQEMGSLAKDVAVRLGEIAGLQVMRHEVAENIAGLIVVLTCVPLFAAILRVPFSVIAPCILVICAVGAYTVQNSMFDVWMMLVFGVAGYLFKKLQYPLAPLVLAIVLGDRAESSFRQAMLVSQGDMTIFFQNKLVGGMTTLALVLLAWPLIAWVIAKARRTSA